MSLTDDRPFLLAPAGKDYLWGGTRLKTDFGKALPMEPLAETWECSTHPDGVSTVASGAYAGLPLDEVLRLRPGYLGRHRNPEGQLPILVKLIDAQRDLSVQVHPTDEFARLHENGQPGKTELWYVLDAQPDTRLVYGLTRTLSPGVLRRAAQTGTIQNYLQQVPIARNDVFYIPAGTIHAIGAGALVAEVQQSSNLTYRLYDYDRVDKNGQKRPLHLEKALAAADLTKASAVRRPMRLLRYRSGCAAETLARCRYFQVERVLLNGGVLPCPALPDSFRVLLCTEGSGTLTACGEALPFAKGQCIFVPAGSTTAQLSGRAQLLRISC